MGTRPTDDPLLRRAVGFDAARSRRGGRRARCGREVIGRKLAVPVKSIPAEQAVEHFGFLGSLLSLDNPASSSLTRELTGWQPTRPGPLEDIEADFYYQEPLTA